MNEYERIAYLVPSEALKRKTISALAEETKEGPIDVMTVDIRQPLSEYRRLCAMGYSCIIARGGIYRDLSAVADSIPVIHEKIRISDVVQMLVPLSLDPPDLVYVVLHRNVALSFDGTEPLFRFPIRIKRYETLDELRHILEEIPESGVKVLTSGMAAQVCSRTDLELIEIENQDQTIRTTVQNTRQMLAQMRDNIQRVNVMESVYNNIDNGILIFDQQEIIQDMNRQAEKLLGVSMDKIIGTAAGSVIPNMPPRRSDGSCSIDSPAIFTRKMNRFTLNFQIHPFDYYAGSRRYIVTLQDITRIQEAERAIRVQLAKKGLSAEYTFSDILTEDPQMEHLIKKAETIAACEGSVLIYGESGTGKELFAQGIHNASPNKNGPFVAINCGALTESLLESELFGYVGGAFTGARKEGKAGLFEMAHKGTIFLDEINSTPLNLQTKILRVLETQTVMRVGSDYVIPLELRIIAASNNRLEEDIRAGRFRRDLFFRLNTFQLEIPPIRERKGDILLLFSHYLALQKHCRRDEIHLEKEFIQALLHYSWPGNVREIRNTAFRYHAFDGDNSQNDILKYETGGEIVREDQTVSLDRLRDTIDDLIVESLSDRGLTREKIAEAMGITRQALYKRMKKEKN